MTMTPQIEQYLDRITKQKHFSHADTCWLAGLVQKARQNRALIPDNLSETEARAVCRQEAEGEWARQQLIKANLRLVIKRLGRYRGDHSFDDLLQAGTVGLIHAVDTFDPARGITLSTHAYQWIGLEIHKATSLDRLVRLPQHADRQAAVIRNTANYLAEESGETPTAAQIAEETGIDVEQVAAIVPIINAAVSLSTTPGDDAALGERLPDVRPLPDDQAVDNIDTAALYASLACLTPMQREIIDLHFGLTSGEPLTYDDIAARLNMSRQSAQQFAKRALTRLRGSALANVVADAA